MAGFRRIMSIVLVCSTLWLSRSEAQGDAPAASEALKKQASGHFERGVTLFRDGAYRAALIEFERAYATVPDHRLLYNQAQMRMLLQDYLGATRDYERYLIEGGSRVPPERLELVEKELSVLRTRVARIAIHASHDHAKVYIDDALVGETPLVATLPLNVGRHRVYAETPDGASAAVTVDLAAGEMQDVELTLRAPRVRTVVVQESSAPPVVAPRRTKRAWAITSSVATALFAGGAAGAGFSAKRAEDDLSDAVSEIPARAGRIDRARKKARTLSISTDVLGAAAVASGVVAVVLWVVSNKEEREGKLHADVGPAGVTLHGRF